MRRIITPVLLSVLFLFRLIGQEVSFTYLDTRAGLSNASVSSIVQDSDGFLWFGTQGGLNRFDGYSFRVFENEPYNRNSLSHNLVQTLFMDDKDILWVGTYGGLNRFDIKRNIINAYRFSHDNKTSLSNDVVISVYRDSRGNLWVGTQDGLNLMDEQKETFTRFRSDPNNPGGLQGNLIRSILEDPRGNLWIATSGGGLSLYNYNTGTFTTFRNDPKDRTSIISDYVMALAVDEDGYLWAGTWFGGISRYDHVAGVFTNYPTSDQRVYTLNTQEKGVIRIGTWGGGLIEYYPKENRFVNHVHTSLRDSLSNNIVYSMHIDRAGDLWVGTNGGGINHLGKSRRSYSVISHNPDDPASLSAGKVNAILEDSSGGLWIGLYNGGLNHYNPETGVMRHYKADPKNKRALSNNIVTSIFEDSMGLIWVTTNDGINRYDPDTGGFHIIRPEPGNDKSLSDNIVYSLIEDPLGNFWIGTYTKGLDYLVRSTGEFYHYPSDPDNPDSISDNLVYSLIFDKSNTLWIATNNGLNSFKNGKFKRYFHNPDDTTSLSSSAVRVLYVDTYGVLWIGTVGGGLCRYIPETDSFHHYTTKEGMPSNFVVGILEDSNGNIWVSTKGGIAILDRDTKVIRKLAMDSYFQNMELHHGFFQNDRGELFLGGTNAIFRINPDKIEYNTHIPPIVFTSMKVFNEERVFPKPLHLVDKVIIRHNENYVSFSFAALDFRDPSKNQYAYKLEGFDRDWVYCGTRNYASYTNLPGGNYIFRVKGSNNDGIWNEEGISVNIKVKTPPWLAWYAFIFYFFLIAVLVNYLSTSRSKKILRKKVEELLETKRMLEEANKQLADLTILDPLTGIWNRRKLTEELEMCFQLALRERANLAVIMADLDYFKRYNDHYGHQKGDECLRSVARAINECLSRKTDFCARYGGEEFIVVLPNTDLEGARLVAHKIKDTVESLKIPHVLSDISENVTISLGIMSGIPETGNTPESFVQKADDSLYRAKLSGRNRISE